MQSIPMPLLTPLPCTAADTPYERKTNTMNKILEICTMMISITETLMHSNWQLTESQYLSDTGNKALAYDLQENISDQLGECLDKIGEVLHSCKDCLPFDEDEDEDDETYDEDEDESDEEDDLTDLHPDMSPETRAEFSRMLDLTDNAINREHMSRLAANTGKPERASLMHQQAENFWNEAFMTMCNYVAMSHKDTIAGIMQKM